MNATPHDRPDGPDGPGTRHRAGDSAAQWPAGPGARHAAGRGAADGARTGAGREPDSSVDPAAAGYGALFRGAAADAPPARFGHAQVVARSQAITRRRRVLAVAAGAVVVLGVGAAVGTSGGGQDAASVASGSAAERGESSSGEERAVPFDLAPEQVSPFSGPGGDGPGGDGGAPTPLGPAPGDCGEHQDPQLRAVVEQVAPEVVGAAEAPTTRECLLPGERRVSVELASGVFGVTYLPPDAAVSLEPGTPVAFTASGGTVLVSGAPPDTVPQDVADALAALL